MRGRRADRAERAGLWRSMLRYRQHYVMLLPFFAIFAVFTIWPVVMSVVLSFTSYNVFQTPQFVGWRNYIDLFVNDDVFPTALRNTLVFSLFTGPMGFLLSMFLAWVINELPRGVRELMTLVFYAPSIAGNAFAVWLLIFDGDIYGYLNSLLMRLGAISEPIQWLTDPKYMMAVVVVVQLWLSMGTSFLTMRAGFNTVDRQYYEAAAVDGVRDRWQELWFVTIPIMVPHLMLSAVLSITAAFGAYNVATVMTGFPSTNYATHTIVHHMVDYAYIRFDRGYACAIATVLFAGCWLLNFVIGRALRKVGQ